MPCCGWLCGSVYLLLAYIVYRVVDRLYRTPRVGDYSSRHILVTGCDSGFGQQIARRLDTLGCTVFAGCLTEAGETELRKTCSSRLHAVSLDVSKQDSVRQAYQYVLSKLPHGTGLWAVMNNAGILGRCGPHEWLNMEDYNQVLSVNLLGLIDVTMTFLPLVKKSRGRIVNTASVFGRHVIAGCPQYCVSKYGVEAFTDGLRRALNTFQCKAILIEPGLHSTQITSRENIEKSVTEAWNRAPADAKDEYGDEYYNKMLTETYDKNSRIYSARVSDVVDAYEHALLGLFPRARYVVGNDARYLWLPLQALPEWLGDWIIDHMDMDKPVPAATKKL
jgi:NAD(P)-dependent dehydrogenase (short-subunit alcohol dehydrogenase family)